MPRGGPLAGVRHGRLQRPLRLLHDRAAHLQGARERERSYDDDDDVIVPSEVFGNMHLVARHFTPGRQEDAHEMLRLTLQAMDKDCLINSGRPLRGGEGSAPGPQRLLPPTVVERVFQGKFQNQVEWSACGAVTSPTRTSPS